MKGIDYSIYIFSKREWALYIVQGIVMISLICYLFYYSFWAILAFSPVLICFLKEKKRMLIKKRRQLFNQQFKDGINAVAGALSVGYAIENAWREAYKDMNKLYGEKAMITQELSKITRQLEMNISIEEIIEDLGGRTQVEDVIDFSEVFQVAQKTGGDLVQIIQSTAEIIEDKEEIEQDIQTILSGKQLELKAMLTIPFGIMIFIKVTTCNYFFPMYGNVLGILVMTVCLGVYIVAACIGKRLIEIEV